MRYLSFTVVMVLGAVAAGSRAVHAEDPVPSDAPGWTGVTNPEGVILARQALMVEIERLMRPIDSFTVGDPVDPAELKSLALTVSQIMLAVPHLFPPTTNLYDPEAELPVTIAMPAIWDDFATFETLSQAAASAAEAMSTMSDAALRNGALNVRAACDACHALYLRPYVAPTVTSEDLDFDFDAFFEHVEQDTDDQ